MNSNNVKSYSNEDLLNRVKSLPSFKAIPENFWFIAVRSDENESDDRFHDKLYLFHNTAFVEVYKITTNAGRSGLRYPVNPHGCAVLKSDEFFYNAWTFGQHKGKVWAYVQARNLPVYRDTDRDDYAEEQGTLENGVFGINIHPSSYLAGSNAEREFIGPWSVGCLVFAIRAQFDDFMRRLNKQPFLSGALIKEF